MTKEISGEAEGLAKGLGIRRERYTSNAHQCTLIENFGTIRNRVIQTPKPGR